MWLIIGYGNLLRGDDGVGRHLAELLAESLAVTTARILPVHQLTPELALEIANLDIDRVLFIDARYGQTDSFIIHKLEPASGNGSCGHQLSPALLLRMAGDLYGNYPKAWFLTLPAVEMAFGDRLSPTAEAALLSAVLRVRSLLDSSRSLSDLPVGS